MLTPTRPDEIVLLTAPAGAGKSTALAEAAHSWSHPTAWLTLDAADRAPGQICKALAATLANAVGEPGMPTSGIDELSGFLADRLDGPLTLVLDDAHTIYGSEAESLLWRLVDYAPPLLSFVLAARHRPPEEWARRRAQPHVREVDPDVLRFRPWEIADLAEQRLVDPLLPQEVDLVCARTAGWAAGVQLLLLALAGSTGSARSAILRPGQVARHQYIREYLTSEVLDRLDAGQRSFVLRASAFDRMTVARCNRLLERADAGEVLEDLFNRALFITAEADGSSYRFHDLFRWYLTGVARATFGTDVHVADQRRAAAILLEDGDVDGAVRCLARAECWTDVTELLRNMGAIGAVEASGWMELATGAQCENDPWILSAIARHQTRRGNLWAASEAFGRASALLGGDTQALGAEAARRSLEPWLDPVALATDPVGSILVRLRSRADTRRSPAEASLAVSLLTKLTHGEFRQVAELGPLTLEDPDDDATALVLVAALCASGLIRDEDAARRARRLLHVLERDRSPALVRVAEAILAADRGEIAAVRSILNSCEADGDRWFAAAIGAVAGLRLLGTHHHGVAGELLSSAATGFEVLGAAVPARWCRLGSAIGSEAEPLPDDLSGPPSDPFGSALAWVASSNEVAPTSRVRAQAESCGVSWLLQLGSRGPVAIGDVADVEVVRAPRTMSGVELRCYGPFRLRGGRTWFKSERLKPQAVELLQLLAVSVGERVHRDTLIVLLWPDVEPEKAVHRFQVVASAIRTEVRAQFGDDSPVAVVRSGSTYELDLGTDFTCDVLTLNATLGRERKADPDGALADITAMVQLVSQPLLPDHLTKTWAHEKRQQLWTASAEWVTKGIIELHDRGHVQAAFDASRVALDAGMGDDETWRIARETARHLDRPLIAADLDHRYEDLIRSP